MNDYPRFKWLVPGKLAGAPHPELYGGLEGVAPFLREQGVGAIVTLCDKPLVSSGDTHGFKCLFVETQDFRPPADLPRVLSFIDREIANGLGVVVHCFAGIGRTGTVLTAWLLKHEPSLTVEQAIARVRDEYVPEYARGRFPEHPSQAEALEVFARAR